MKTGSCLSAPGKVASCTCCSAALAVAVKALGQRIGKKTAGACFCTPVGAAKSITALGVPGPSLSLAWKFFFQALKAERVHSLSLRELFKGLEKVCTNPTAAPFTGKKELRDIPSARDEVCVCARRWWSVSYRAGSARRAAVGEQTGF